jgi:putative ABC transport system permease protein
MSYWKIAWRNIEQRALASSLTALSMALGVALMTLVLVIHNVVVKQLSNDAQGYNFIIGSGQGSKFEVVLSSVFHIGTPLNTIPYRYYKEFVEGEYKNLVDAAIPLCLGDSYGLEEGQRFRVVGTSAEMFDQISYGANPDGTEKRYEFSSGRNFKNERFFEAVIGAVAANRTGLKVGDKFRPTHGLGSAGDKHDEFEIVGVLAPTGTANDRALYVNFEGFLLLDGHALKAPEGFVAEPDPTPDDGQPPPLPEVQRQVTSILVRCPADNPFAPSSLEKLVNKREDRAIQAVAPVYAVEQLQATFINPLRLVLLVLTVLIVVVSGVSILVSIYNSMSERGHDIAVMRALGASRGAVMVIVLVESILLSLIGAAGGLLLGHSALAAASPLVEFHTGLSIRPWDFTWLELLLIPALATFAALVGFLPALTAYRTDVAKTLGGAR